MSTLREITNETVLKTGDEITVNGLDSALSEMRDLVDEIVSDNNLEAVKSQLDLQTESALKGSVTIQILKGHLDNMLCELEAYHQTNGKFESYEFAEQYCEAAKAMRQLGRKGDIEAIVSEQMKTM